MLEQLMVSSKWGHAIDAMHADPLAPKRTHTIERDGCLLPANFCLCTKAQSRSYLWITESGVEENLAYAPCCCIGNVEDRIWKTYFDNGPFKPCCGLEKGIATEDDLNYCCWCINCVCYYNMCTKPCFGGNVAVVLVPNSSPCLYKIATRCCQLNPLCVSPVLFCVKDSKAGKEQLIAAMRAAEARKKAGPGAQVEVQAIARA